MTQISEKEHPELARSLNEMTTLLSRDHTEKDWKWSVLRVLRALACEAIKPPMYVVCPEDVRLGPATPGPMDDGGLTIKAILDKVGDRIKRECIHTYSKSMDQVYPRKCLSCGEPEIR